MIVLPQIGSKQGHFTTLLTILLLSCLVFYFIFSSSNIKKKKGGEFNDIWEVRQADGSPLKLEEDVNFGLVGRRRISKFEDPEPLNIQNEATIFNIGTMKAFPFVVAECMCDPPLKFVLPWWHPQIPNIMSQGGKLKPSSDMVFFKNMFSDIISSHTSNLTTPSPLMIDIGAQLGFVSLVAASLGIRSIAYEPNPEHAEKFRMSVALNGFNELITVVEAAVSDEAGDTQLSVPVDPRKGSEVRNFRLLDVQMVRADYSVEWLSLLEDIQLLRVWAGGLEYRVLRGASNLFKTNRVKAVLLRFWVEGILRNEDEPMGLLVYLADLGFVLKSMESEPTPYNMHLEFKRLVTLKKPTDLYWVKAERQN